MTSSAQVSDSFEVHRRSVYAWAFRLLGNHHEALDVTQEVFVKWWRAHREQRLPDNPVGWLRRVTINHSINVIRAESRTIDLQHVHRPVAITPPAEAERREAAACIADALQSVSEQQRGVLFAKVYDGCTFARIAQQMGLAVPTVKTHYVRALQAVRRKLSAAGLVPGEDHELQ